MRSPRRWLSVGAVIGAVAAVVPLSVASVSSAASESAKANPTTVTGGVNVKALPGVQALGATTPYTELSLSFIMREQKLPQLEARVDDGVQNFLSVQQFSRAYGQPLSYVNSLEKYLEGYGISHFSLYPGGVDLKAEGTVGDVEAALSVHEENYRVPAVKAQGGMQGVPAQTVHAATTLPNMPEYLAQNLVAILGLTSYAPWVDNVVPPVKVEAKPQTAEVAETNCAVYGVTGAIGLTAACRIPAQFAATYDLAGLYQHGANGRGETLGIVTLAALDTTAPPLFWHTVLGMTPSGRTVSVDTVDGGPGTPSATAGSDETDLDVEQSGALAPDATVVVYQAPNDTAPWVDALFTAASQNVASSVSCSWGFSEPLLEAAGGLGEVSPGFLTALDEAFLEMAEQGQSVFIASGDAGAYAGHRTLGSTNLSVGGPADSPYVTSAGGTTLPTAAFGVTAQRAWGWDYLWPFVTVTQLPEATVATFLTVGGTGGYSQYEPLPSYQYGVSGVSHFSDVAYHTPDYYLTVAPGVSLPFTWTFTPAPTVGQGQGGTGRAEPDISTDADPETGYLYYEPASTGGIGLNDAGGTSFVAPELNGSAAVIDSYVHHRTGLWNPVIYRVAANRVGSPFTPLDKSGTTNDNLYYTGTPQTVWNPATGLGYPNLTELARVFLALF